MEPDEFSDGLDLSENLDPDQSASTIDLSNRTGMPKSDVLANPQYAAMLAKRVEIGKQVRDSVATLSPYLKELMADPFHAAAMSDSIPALAGLRAYNKYMRPDETWGRTIGGGVVGGLTDFAQMATAIPEGLALGASKLAGRDYLPWDPLTAKIQDYKNSQSDKQAETYRSTSQRLVGGAVQSLANPINLAPLGVGYTAARLGYGAVSATAAMATTAAIAEAYSTQTQQMVERQQAGEKSWVTAADLGNTLVSSSLTFAAGMFGGLQTSLVIGPALARSGTARTLLGDTARSGIGSVVEGGGQAISQAGFKGEEIRLADVLEGAAGEMLPELFFGGLHVATSPFSRARRVAETTLEAATALNTAARIEDSQQKLHDSGFGKRAPDSLISAVANAQITGDLFITVEDFAEYKAANPQSKIAFVAVDGGYTVKEADVVASNDKAVIGYLRNRMDGISPNESAEAIQSQSQEMKDIQESIATPTVLGGSADDTSAVATQIKEQVDAAGVQGSTEAGVVVGNMYRNMAEQIAATTGEKITPGELHAKIGVTVAAPAQTKAVVPAMDVGPKILPADQQQADEVVKLFGNMDPKKRRDAVIKDLRSRLQIGANKATKLADEALAKANLPLQQKSSDVRGGYNPVTNVVSLFQNSNVTTTFHELGHHYLNMLQKLSSDEKLKSAIAGDLDTLKKWWSDNATDVARLAGELGNTRVTADSIRAASANFETLDAMSPEWAAMHEYFGYGFEQYMGEGKAPTKELDSVFRRLRDWFLAAYAKMGESYKVNLSPEVRTLMDKLVAGQTAIDDGLGPNVTNSVTAEMVGLPQAVFDRGLKRAQSSIDAMHDKLMQETVASIQKEIAVSREKYAGIVDAAIAADPAYQDMASIGVTPGTRPTVVTPKIQEYLNSNNLTFDELAANAAAMESRDDMIQAEMASDGQAMTMDQIRAKAAEQVYGGNRVQLAAVEAAMYNVAIQTTEAQKANVEAMKLRNKKLQSQLAALKEHHKDRLAEYRKGISERMGREKEKYQERLDTLVKRFDEKVAQLEQEIQDLKDLAKNDKDMTRVAMADMIRQREGLEKQAKIMARLSVAKLTYDKLDPTAYQKAARSFATKTMQAISRRDMHKAASYKARELQAVALVNEIEKARADMDRKAANIRTLANKTQRKELLTYGMPVVVMPNGTVQHFLYPDAARNFAAENKLVATTSNTLYNYVVGNAERLGLTEKQLVTPADFLEASREYGLQVDNRKYTELTHSELDDAYRLMETTVNVGKTMAAAQVDMTSKITELVDAARQSKPALGRMDTNAAPVAYAAQYWGADGFAKLYVKLQSLGKGWMETVKIPLRRVENEFTRREQDVLTPLADLSDKLRAHDRSVKQTYLGRGKVSRNEIVSLCAVYGSGREGQDRVNRWLIDNGFIAGDAEQLFATINADEKAFIEGLWEAGEKTRVIAEGEMRLAGVPVPDWIKPTAFTAGGNSFAGGYASINSHEQMNYNLANPSGAHLSLRLGGWTVDRAMTISDKSVKNLRWDPNQQVMGLRRKLREVTVYRFAKDMTLVFGSPAIREAISINHGDTFYDNLKTHMELAINGPVYTDDVSVSFFRNLRANYITGAMALKVISGVQQVAGLASSMSHPDISAVSLARSAGEVLRNPKILDQIYAESPHMARRRNGEIMADLADAKLGGANVLNSLLSPTGITVSPSLFPRIRSKLMTLVTLVQHYAVDVPTYLAAKEKYLGQNIDPYTASLKASEVVDQTQGGADYSELSTIQKTELFRSLLTLQSYKLTQMSRVLSAVGRYKRGEGSIAEIGSATISAVLIPSAAMYALGYALKNVPSDDDDQPWLANMLATATADTFGMHPAASWALQGFFGYSSASEAAPGLNAVTGSVRGMIVGSSSGDEDKINSGRIKAAINASSAFVPLPTSVMKNVVDASYGDYDADEAAFWSRIFFGRPMKSVFTP